MNIINLQDIKRRGVKTLSPDRPNYLVINLRTDYVITSKEECDSLIELAEYYEDMMAVTNRKKEKSLSENAFWKKYHREV